MGRLAALDLAAVKSAVRLTIVATPLFAVGEVVLDNQDVALFAFFGAFALLLFAQFDGPMRSRLGAYLGLAGGSQDEAGNGESEA